MAKNGPTDPEEGGVNYQLCLNYQGDNQWSTDRWSSLAAAREAALAIARRDPSCQVELWCWFPASGGGHRLEIVRVCGACRGAGTACSKDNEWEACLFCGGTGRVSE